MTEEQKTFLETLKHICLRPAMYVGVCNVRLVTTLLMGMSWGHDCGKRGRFPLFVGGALLDGFPSWLMEKYQTNHPAWGWTRVLFHQHDHDHKAAIGAIPVLYEEFLGERDAYIAKLQETIGRDCLAPEAPACEECEGWQLNV